MQDTQNNPQAVQLPTITVLTPEAFAAVVPMENPVFYGNEAHRSSGDGIVYATRIAVVSSFDKEGRPVRYSEVIFSGPEAFLAAPIQGDIKARMQKAQGEVKDFIDDLVARGYKTPLDGVIGYPK